MYTPQPSVWGTHSPNTCTVVYSMHLHSAVVTTHTTTLWPLKVRAYNLKQPFHDNCLVWDLFQSPAGLIPVSSKTHSSAKWDWTEAAHYLHSSSLLLYDRQPIVSHYNRLSEAVIIANHLSVSQLAMQQTGLQENIHTNVYVYIKIFFYMKHLVLRVWYGEVLRVWYGEVLRVWYGYVLQYCMWGVF